MAKSKKSKILASMLAVSTMAVFYAAPVMAGDANIDATQGQGITINVAVDGDPDAGGNGLYTQGPAGLIDYRVHGQLTITSANLVTALEGQTFNDLTINNLDTTNLTVNGETVDLSQLADVDLSNVKGITRSAGATTPGTGTTTIEGVLSVDGTTHEIYNAGNTFNVDDSGNVDAASFHATTGDVSTTRYSLNTVGADLDTVEQRTQKITYVQSVDTTNISGRVIASGVTLNNGNISTNGTLVAKEVANASGDTLSGVAGDVDDLTLSVASVSELTQNIDADRTTAGITTFKGDVNVDGNVKAATADFGQMTLNGQRVLAANHVLTVGDETLNFRKANQTIENTAGIERESGVDFAGRPLDTTTIEGKTTIDSLGRLNTDTVIATTGQFGDVIVTGNSLTNVGFINGAEVSGSNGALTISGVELNNGLVDGVDVSELSSAATDISGLVKKTAGIDKVGAVTTVEGVSFAQGRMDADYVLTDGLKVNGLSDLDGVKVQNGSVYAENDSYVGGVQLADGNVTATEVTAGGYKLTDIGKNTQDIKYNNGVTTIGGETLAVTDEGYVTINNGAFAVGPDGMATVGNNIKLDGETGVVSANDLRANNNVYSKNYNLEEVGDNLDDLTGSVGNIGDNVAGIRRDAAEGAAYGEGVTSIEGSTSFDANGMNVGNGAVVANTDGSFSAGNGSFKVSDGVTTIGGETLAVTDEGYVTINNGAFSVGPDGMVAVGNSIQLDGETGVVSANDLRANNNVYSKNYNLEEVGADLKELSGDFTTTNANVAGIERIGEGAPGEGITTIEGDALFVSKNVTYMSSGDAMIQTSTDSAYMSFGDNMISINKGGINLTGSVGFTGHDGGRYTLSDLEGRVYDLEQKTQNITSADPGQGGSSEVPPTGDGHTGFEGDVTVGDNVTVGGDANIDGNANVSGNVNVDGQINVGSTVVDKNGITAENGTFTNVNVGGENGTSINHDEVRVGGADGSYMNENDVVTGEGNSLNDTANRVGNLEQGVSELNNRVGELEDRIDKVGAMAAAIANLRTMGYDPAAPTEVAVGIGQYRDETGAALGLFHYPNRDFMLSLSVSTSGDEVMGGIGATWKFGRKSPEKVAEIKKAQAEADARRSEEAKLAKAEEIKQAAKEAKIKAQQERHAKLAAERAAQAEAAK